MATRLAIRLETQPAQLLVRIENNLLGTLPLALSQLSTALETEGVTFENLPNELHERWIAADGRHRIEVIAAEYIQQPEAMRRFVDSVREVIPKRN